MQLERQGNFALFGIRHFPRAIDHLRTLPIPIPCFVDDVGSKCRREIHREHLRTELHLLRVIAGPQAAHAAIIVIGVYPFVRVVDGDLVPGIKVMIDFPVELQAVGIEGVSAGEGVIPEGMPAPGPLSYGGVESITAVKGIRVRHGGEELLAGAGGIQLRAIRIPRRAADDRVGAIGLCRIAHQRTEHTAVLQLGSRHAGRRT